MKTENVKNVEYPGLSKRSQRWLEKKEEYFGVHEIIKSLWFIATLLMIVMNTLEIFTFVQCLGGIIFIAGITVAGNLYYDYRVRTGKDKDAKVVFDDDKKEWEKAQELKHEIKSVLNDYKDDYIQFGEFTIRNSIINSGVDVQVSALLPHLDRFDALWICEESGNRCIVPMVAFSEERQKEVIAGIFKMYIDDHSGTHIADALNEISDEIIEALSGECCDLLSCVLLEQKVTIGLYKHPKATLPVIIEVEGKSVFPAGKFIAIQKAVEKFLYPKGN